MKFFFFFFFEAGNTSKPVTISTTVIREANGASSTNTILSCQIKKITVAYPCIDNIVNYSLFNP